MKLIESHFSVIMNKLKENSLNKAITRKRIDSLEEAKALHKLGEVSEYNYQKMLESMALDWKIEINNYEE